MNDKLNQSLKARLSGMRWGEREQAEVFRQIQRKEMHEVKHVKRGTSMLALAAALLFFVMGAALAVTGTGQPDDTYPLTQTTQTVFTPVPVARAENDYLVMTVDSAEWYDSEVTIDLTLRLKEPEKFGLIIGSYANPGGTERTMLTAELLGGCIFSLNGRSASAVLRSPEVLNMTGDSATIRVTNHEISAGMNTMDVFFDLEVQGKGHQDILSLEFTIQRGAEQTDSDRSWLFENELITGYLADLSLTEDQLILTVDVEPKKPWYVINTAAEDKSALDVTASWFAGYDGATPLVSVDALAPEYVATPTGARTITALPFPSENHTIQLLSHVTAKDAVSGSEATSLINLGFTRPEAETAPVRSEPKGEHIGGTERVSVYLEDYWFDGFSAEGTLRIRADDAETCRLALKLNEQGMPSETTWVVRLSDRLTGYYHPVYTLTREDATGDVLVTFTHCDPYHSTSGNPQSQWYMDYSLNCNLTLTLTNELTWETESADITMTLPVNGNYAYHPLYLVSSSDEDSFIQAGYITTDRYHYIGVMRTYDNYFAGMVLSDAAGNVLGKADSIGAANLNIIPRLLFPYDGDNDLRPILSAVRIDNSVPLPEVLHVGYNSAYTTDLPSFVLTANPEAAAVKHSVVSIVLDQNVLFDNEYMTVKFVDADFGEGHAAAHLTATLREPDKFSFVPDETGQSLTCLDMRLGFYDAISSATLQEDAECFTVFTDCYSSESMEFYIHGSSDAWQEAAPHLFAQMRITSADGSIQETYTAEFTFPEAGHVSRFQLAPVAAQPITLLSGDLIRTSIWWVIDFQYRCTDPDMDAYFLLNVSGAESTTYSRITTPDPDDPLLRQATLYINPFGLNEQAQLSLVMKDRNTPAFRADIPLTLIPIAE